MDDSISRQDAINALWEALYEYEDKTEKQFQASDELNIGDWFIHRIFVQNMSDIDRQTILNLPSADTVKHGRWIKMTGMMPPEYHGHYECSECQWHMKGVRSSWTREEEFNYCPNCGAKMDEVSE